MTPYKQAIDAFAASEEFETSSDPATLQAPAKMRQYIENRLHRAFMAGWAARGQSETPGEPHGT